MRTTWFLGGVAAGSLTMIGVAFALVYGKRFPW